MPVTGSKTISYNLSIRVKADGFSFLVTEGNSGDNLLCQDFSPSQGQELYQLLAEKLRMPALEQYAFSRVRVVTYTDATSIPQQEFAIQDLGAVYATVFPKIDEQLLEVCYTHLPQLDIVQAFAIPRALRSAVEEVYPDATYTNASAMVLGRIATFCKRQQLPDNSLFAYTTPQQLFLFSIAQDKLQFANTFPLDQPKDSLFYLLSVWKVLGLRPRANHCYIAGESDSVAYLLAEAGKYIQHVDVLSLSFEV